MNKVITINLNGRAYQVEEAGYEALRVYLENALQKLKEDPDKEEIRLDLEQAVAEKLKKFLTAHKTVITEAEIRTVIEEMGPVEAAQDTASGDASSKKESSTAPKHLYNIREGAMIAGVCTGIAAYFNLDVTLVRVMFVILAVLTHGGFIFVYALMMIFVPYAHTSEQKARAYGMPFTAQELIDNAKKSYEGFKMHRDIYEKSKPEWKHAMKEHKRKWKEERHHGPLEELWSLLGIVAWVLVISFGLWYGYHHSSNVKGFLDATHTEYTHVIQTIEARL